MLVAAIHFRPTHRAFEENQRRLLVLVEDALRQGAELVVAPELALSGFAFATPDEIRPYAVTERGDFTRTLITAATTHDAIIVVGVPELDRRIDRLFNAALVARPRNVTAVHGPRFPHNYGWITGYGDGWANLRLRTPRGMLRLALCAGLLTLSDDPPAEIVAVPAAWNDDPPGSCLPLWQSIARQRRSALIIANRYGEETYSTGHAADFRRAISCIIDRDGRILAQSSAAQHDEILFADLISPLLLPGLGEEGAGG